MRPKNRKIKTYLTHLTETFIRGFENKLNFGAGGFSEKPSVYKRLPCS